MNDLKKPWIEEGYFVFATEGPTALKIERLAKNLSINKSSFYHHFATLDIFIATLLRHHIAQVKIIAAKEANCENQQELVEVLVEHKIDLLFSRQLRIHNNIEVYERCSAETNSISIPGFIKVWARIIDLQDNSYLAELVLHLSMENFFLQINLDNLNRDWLNNYFDQLKTMVREFKKQNHKLV